MNNKNTFLLLLTLFISIGLVAQRNNESNKINSSLKPFYHGVASGDPTDSSVILWTRVTPDTINSSPVSVSWRIALDTGMTNVVASGYTTTNLSKDLTVKIDVTGLQPKTCYYYDFSAFGFNSIRGRTKTAPKGDTDSLRFAVVSCSNYEHGYFNAYRKITQRNDVDAIIHLGDYIYEYETGGYSANINGRSNDPVSEIISLTDYRLRYSHYRLDEDLMRLHQQYPFITIWDDHESANDSYIDGAENHDTGTEGSWHVRKSNAKKSYFEWMPVREKGGADSSIYRKFSYGDLFNLYMLDTRLEGRVEQVGATSSLLNDPSRTLLGATQYNWLVNELTSSTAKWNVLGQQVMIAPLKIAGIPVNTDQWDGYPIERNNLLNAVMLNNVDNLVVLTGDIHTSWANDIPLGNYNPSTGANSAGVEFVVTSITSAGFPFSVGTSIIQSSNSHMKWIDLTKHGYLILDVNKQRVQGDWYFVNDVATITDNETLGNAFYTNDGERFLRQASLPSQGNGLMCLQAPLLPKVFTVGIFENKQDELTFFGSYPNPAFDEITLQFSLEKSSTMMKLSIVDIFGKEVYVLSNQSFKQGINYVKLDVSALAKGTYVVVLQTQNSIKTQKIIKH